MQQEKLAKKEAAGKSKQKENGSIKTEDTSSELTQSERKTRGAKRQPELLSPSEKIDTTARKRLRKNNLSDANILNVIDEEELQKRAAKVSLSLHNQGMN